MYILEKDFRFETAHRLGKGYAGKCQNPHGHSWNGKFKVSTNSLNQYDMAVDFGDMKNVYKKWIDDLDHSMMLFHKDIELINLFIKMDWKVWVFNMNPTSEVVALFLTQQWQGYFKGTDVTIEVTINETCTSSCTVIGTEGKPIVEVTKF